MKLREKDLDLRIGNNNVPSNKHLCIALTYISGIGRCSALKILSKLQIKPNAKVFDLSSSQRNELINEVENNYLIDNALKKKIEGNIMRLIRINCYRGTRHQESLPIHGRTKSNARTHKKLRAKNRKFFHQLIS